MILVVSSRRDVVSSDINENGLEFFKQSTSLLAQIYLNSYLESKDIECSVSLALVIILMHGSFLWSNAVTPSGLSASVITTKDIIANNSLHNGIVLDYSMKHKITDESLTKLTKLTKTQVIYPTDIEATIQRIDALMALSELFFGENSYLVKGLDQFVFNYTRNKILNFFTLLMMESINGCVNTVTYITLSVQVPGTVPYQVQVPHFIRCQCF